MSNNIAKRKEELRIAYEMARGGTIQEAKVFRTFTDEYVRKHFCGPNGKVCDTVYEEELNTNQDYKSYERQYDPAITAAVKVVGKYHGCKVTVHIHR